MGKNTLISSSLKTQIKNYLMIIAGSFIMAFGIDIFIKANNLAVGGFSGIGLLLNYNFGISIGLFFILTNIPLLLISWKVWGPKYVMSTLVGVLSNSFAIELFSNLSIKVDDLLLPAIYGGLCSGVGTGIVMRGSGTMGGTDILAQLCHKYKGTSLGSFYLAFDACVLIAVTLIYDLTVTLYSLVAVFISSQVVNLVVDGMDRGKEAFIISEKPREVADYIRNDLGRGFTYINGRGGFEGAQREIILCVVTRWQIFKLRQAVNDIDPGAFIIIGDAHEVYGKGFRETQ